MPYIKPKARDELLNRSDVRAINSSGELNFMFTELIKKYLRHKGSGYAVFNDVIGALDGAKLEFYRRVVAPYEDRKIEENGDVY